jgi:hypothetical protein
LEGHNLRAALAKVSKTPSQPIAECSGMHLSSQLWYALVIPAVVGSLKIGGSLSRLAWTKSKILSPK